MKAHLPFSLSLLSLLVSPAPAQGTRPWAVIEAGTGVSRRLDHEGRTTAILAGDRVFPVEDQGFRILLEGGEKALTPSEMVPSGKNPGLEGKELVFSFQGKGGLAPLGVRVILSSPGRGVPLFRKTLELSWKGSSRAPLVKAVEVERLRFTGPGGRPLELSRGREETGGPRRGTGIPLFAGKTFFLGLEHPAGWNLREPEGLAVLRHHPEKRPPFTTFTAVLGVSPRGTPHRAFRAYLDGFRRRPPIPFPHYNSWYDMESTLSAKGILESARGFKEAKIPIVSMAVDDIWQDRKSIWRARKDTFPGGLLALSRNLEKLGFRLGLWMPLCGFHLDTDWGAARGYEKAPEGKYYLLSGPKYRAALKARIRHFIRDCRVDYFKMDFNFQLIRPKTPAAFERGVNETLSLLEYMASLDPKVFLNVTSFVHLSPWWLKWADFCWLGGSDVGYDSQVPAIRGRDRAMTYRDQRVYKNILHNCPDFPLNALMFHGITHGRLCLPGGPDEPPGSFLDACVLFLGRGCMLQEVYVTPSTMTGPLWADLRESLEWSARQKDILAQAQAFGGEPAKGEVLGYRAARGGEAVLTLRNPALETKKVEIPLRDLYVLTGTPPAQASPALIYPRRRRLPVLDGKGSLRFTLGAHETLVARIWPEGKRPALVENWPEEVDPPPACRILSRKDLPGGGTEIQVLPAPGCASSLVAAQRTRRGGRRAPLIRVAGKKVKPRYVGKRSAWWTGVVDLPPGGPVRVRLEPGLPPMGGKGEIRVYLLSSRKESSPPLPGTKKGSDYGPVLPGAGPFPPVLDRPERIRGILGWKGTFSSPGPARSWPRRIPRDPSSVKALYLALDIFGSNPGLKKEVLVGGKAAALLPANQGKLDAWDPCLVPLPSELLEKALAGGLEVRVKNNSGDYFKLRNPRLAVRLKGGSLVLGPPARGVWTGVKKWAFFEGKPFRNHLSPSWRLTLP